MNDENKKLLDGEHPGFSGQYWIPANRTGNPPVNEEGLQVSSRSWLEMSHRDLQKEIWAMFVTNPQIYSSVEDRMGRLAAKGFSISCGISEINDYLKKIYNDPRNRLYNYMPKYAARADVEGELFLSLTAHEDGFIEIDFIEPRSITEIIRHPDKPQMPLFYKTSKMDDLLGSKDSLIPSIYMAYYPNLWKVAEKLPASEFNKELLKQHFDGGTKFKGLKGYQRFVIEWDRSHITDRNSSHLRTTLKWIHYYEDLKEYEIDHKKSSGAYLWTINFEDVKAYNKWMALTDDEKTSTGIMAPKMPGGTLILPPGMSIEVRNPTLPKISDADNDIMHMVTSGLNQPEDMTTGQASGTYSSVKATRAPQSDRMADLAEYFERFLRYDMYRPIFFLANKMGVLKETYKVREAVEFKGKKPIFKEIDHPPHELIKITFPISELTDLEAKARGLLGVKHGSVVNSLGIAPSKVAEKMGFGDYLSNRLQAATEEELYPELAPEVDQEMVQEKTEGEPKKTGKVEKTAEKKKSSSPTEKKS